MFPIYFAISVKEVLNWNCTNAKRVSLMARDVIRQLKSCRSAVLPQKSWSASLEFSQRVGFQIVASASLSYGAWDYFRNDHIIIRS